MSPLNKSWLQPLLAHWRQFHKNLDWISLVHRVSSPLLERGGYRFEKRRLGGIRLGLFRKIFRKNGKASRRLVLIPGFGDSPLSWIPIFSAISPWLRKRYDELVMVDFPGFQGFLSKDRPFSSMDLLQKALFDGLDSLKAEVIVGHSLGGWLTVAYAIECGKKARPRHSSTGYQGPQKIILIAPSGILPDQAGGRAAEEWKSKFITAIQENPESFFEFLFSNPTKLHRLVQPSLEEFFSKEEILQFIHSIEERHLVHAQLQHLQCQIEIIWGDQDHLNLTEWLEEWKSKIPGLSFSLIPGAGHMLQLEKPIAMARSLLKTLL